MLSGCCLTAEKDGTSRASGGSSAAVHRSASCHGNDAACGAQAGGNHPPHPSGVWESTSGSIRKGSPCRILSWEEESVFHIARSW